MYPSIYLSIYLSINLFIYQEEPAGPEAGHPDPPGHTRQELQRRHQCWYAEPGAGWAAPAGQRGRPPHRSGIGFITQQK